MIKSRIIVTGATGKTGSVVVCCVRLLTSSLVKTMPSKSLMSQKARHNHGLPDSRFASVVAHNGAVRWLRGVPGVAIAPYRGRTHATASSSSKRVSLLMIVGGLVPALSQSELQRAQNATT
jgi:hypothetical protein